MSSRRETIISGLMFFSGLILFIALASGHNDGHASPPKPNATQTATVAPSQSPCEPTDFFTNEPLTTSSPVH